MSTGLSRNLFAMLFVLLSLVGCSGGSSGEQFPAGTWVVSATAGAGGRVDPARQSVPDGASTSLTVTPDPGYAVAKVSGCNGSLTGNIYTTAPVSTACEIVATFTVEPSSVLHDIVVNAAPADGGSVTGGGSYGDGRPVTVTAQAKAGYEFVNWTEDGSPVAEVPTYSFTATAARALTANFRVRSYEVTATAGTGGSIDPAGLTVEYGTSVDFTVTPDTGYSIAGVKGCNGTLTSPDTYSTAPVTAACRVSATFVRGPAPRRYDVGVSTSAPEAGNVSGGGTYADGADVTLSATASAGYDFVNWTEGGSPVSESATYTFSALGNRTLVANFAIHQYSVTATAGSGGTIDPGSRTAAYGSTTTFTLRPDTGYSIAAVRGCGGSLDGTLYTTGPILGDCTVEASFTEGAAPVIYDVALTAAPPEGGAVDGSGAYAEGNEVSVSAAAAEGYDFVNWTEGGEPVSTGAAYTFTASGDRNLVANFNLRSYSVTANAGAGGSVDATSRTVDHGAVTAFTVTPDTNYSIASASGCGGTLEGNIYTTGPVTADCDVSITFTRAPAGETYNVSVSASPADAGVVSGGGTYAAPAPAGPTGLPPGAEVTVSATANDGYQFTNWTENGTPVSADATYVFTATGDRTLVANFGIRTYQLTSTAGPGGSVTPATLSVEQGGTGSFTLTPETGFSLAGVSGCSGQLSGNIFTTDPVSAACELVVAFSVNSYPVTATAGLHGAIDPAERSVEHGSVTTFTVTPDAGYHVDTISGCEGTLQLDTYTTAPITGACDINAAFAINTYTVTARAGSGGTVDAASRTVEHGAKTTFVFTPDTGYGIAAISGCGGTREGTTYTTGEISADCEVSALFAPLRSIGGTLSGLGAGASITLRNNGGDDRTLSADGPFTFASPVVDGGGYEVTIASQPAGRVCQVVNGVGAAAGADVTSVAVNCPPSAPDVSLAYGIKQLRFSWNGVNGATHYRLFEDPDGASGYTQVGADITATQVSHDIALYKRINARYRVEACNGYGCTGSGDIFLARGLVPAIGYYKGINTEAGDQFGGSVALSADGSTLAIGAYKEDGADNTAYNSGAVYVFARVGAAWTMQAYLKPSNSEGSSISEGFGDMFGHSVALSADGSTLAVGAGFEDSNATGVNGDGTNNLAANSGAVYVFTRSGTSWSEQAYIKASNTDRNDGFGGGNELTGGVALSADGDTLVVGATNEASAASGVDADQTDNSAFASGAAYIFSRSGPTWLQKAYLKASNPGGGDRFGEAVAISADGNTVAVGAPYEASASTGIDGSVSDDLPGSGAVYLFTRAQNNKWSQAVYVKASNPDESDHFGTALCLSGDGSILAVGAPAEDSAATGVDGDGADNTSRDSGAVYIFQVSAAGWAQQAYLKASNIGGGFGDHLSMSTDGSLLAVGAPWERVMALGIDGEQTSAFEFSSGAAYLFAREAGGWSQRAYIKAPNTQSGDLFGTVALSGDGNTLAVGAPWEDSAATGIGGAQADNAASEAGAVYLY